jgi:hypothetical protein
MKHEFAREIFGISPNFSWFVFHCVDALEKKIDMMNLTVAFHNFGTPLQMSFKCTESLEMPGFFKRRVVFITLIYFQSK